MVGPMAFSDDSDNASDVENPYLYTARRMDSESGLMYYRNRQYSVFLGRFISHDPVMHANLYLYTSDRPSVFADALGLMPIRPIRGGNGCGSSCFTHGEGVYGEAGPPPWGYPSLPPPEECGDEEKLKECLKKARKDFDFCMGLANIYMEGCQKFGDWIYDGCVKDCKKKYGSGYTYH